MTTGQRLKMARKKAGLTQAELAAKLNIPYQSISQWERDLRQPKAETLEKIAEALEISPADLGIIRYEAYYQFNPAAHKKILDALNIAFKSTCKLDATCEENTESELLYNRLFQSFFKLNDSGQQEAVKRVEELTEVPKYQRETSQPSTERVEELTEVKRYQKGKNPAEGD